MKHFMLVAALCAGMTCQPLAAQTMKLKADVPFDFQLGDVLMPAGPYQVIHNGPLLTMRHEDGKKIASRLTLPMGRKESANKEVLGFNRYGNEYFLTKVMPLNEADGRTLPSSRREQETFARYGRVETASVALKTK